MQIYLDNNTSQYLIKDYQPGQLRINDDMFDKSVLVSAESLDVNWQPQSISELTAAHVEAISALKPEIFILGTGETQVFPNAELFKSLVDNKIGFEVMTTQAACRTFMVLTSEARRVIAGLIIR